MNNTPDLPAQVPERVNITWHQQSVARKEHEQLHGHRGCVVWFTGLSGSGKSTIANLVDHMLYQEGIHTFLLDGDNIRHGLCASPAILEEGYGLEFSERFGLGFSQQDRKENIRRVGSVSQLFCSAGIVTLTALVSPYREDRDTVRQQVEGEGGGGDFIEVFVDTPLEVCESRDPKGLYKRARAGELKGMTGIDAPYEPPPSPELRLEGGSHSAEALARQVIAELKRRKIFEAGR